MDLSNYSKANRAKIEKEAGRRFRADQLPPCNCGGPAMGTAHAPDCRWELAAESQMEDRYEQAIQDLTEAGELVDLVAQPPASTITLQKIGRKHGDGSLNYDVSICNGRDCVEIACATEAKANELIDALDRLGMDTQIVDDIEVTY